MATILTTVDCKLFQMMNYIIILNVRKFHQPTGSRFITAKEKTCGGGGGHIVKYPLSKRNVDDETKLH